MKTMFSFLVKPLGGKYKNTIDVDGSELILNTSYENYKFINRFAEVIAVPISFKHEIKKGDIILIHHNVFRTWYNIRGERKNSASYIDDDHSHCSIDQIYAIFKNQEWQPLQGYSFVAPVSNLAKIRDKKEKELFGIIKINNKELEKKGIKKNTLISFTPSSEFEFLLNEQKLYRIRNQDITAEYGYSKNEIEYNTSWRKSSGGINKSS